ncbi:DUF1830 domain-containing protein [Microcoleus sp. D2_18a_D3]|uniref:DUF1830 domain-containing protein n=1 Tax=Microcoleus sp. D2_18a_D3 TaxID=3055330 RepID=UPI002FCF43DD
MAQILDPVPSDTDSKILCCYVNATSQIQIARIANIPNWYFERVVFPGQRLVFEAMPAAALEIHTGMMASAILSDKIPCARLQINEGPYSNVHPSRSPEAVQGDRTVMAGRPKSREISEPLTVPALTAVD